MKQVVLMMFLAVALAMPAVAQPDITGTWTGTGTVNSPQGLHSLDMTLEVTSQSGSDWSGTFQIETSEGAAQPTFGRIDTILSLWQIRGAGYGDLGGIVVQGRYTPAVLLVSPASITIEVSYPASFMGSSNMLFSGGAFAYATLTQ